MKRNESNDLSNEAPSMNRRAFLKSAALAGLALGLPLPLRSAPEKTDSTETSAKRADASKELFRNAFSVPEKPNSASPRSDSASWE